MDAARTLVPFWFVVMPSDGFEHHSLEACQFDGDTTQFNEHVTVGALQREVIESFMGDLKFLFWICRRDDERVEIIKRFFNRLSTKYLLKYKNDIRNFELPQFDDTTSWNLTVEDYNYIFNQTVSGQREIMDDTMTLKLMDEFLVYQFETVLNILALCAATFLFFRPRAGVIED